MWPCFTMIVQHQNWYLQIGNFMPATLSSHAHIFLSDEYKLFGFVHRNGEPVLRILS